MSNQLVEENRQLRARLAMLLEQAQRNQHIMQRYQSFDLKFIGAESLRELIESIFDTLSESSQLDVVTLTLIDGDYEIRRIMADLMLDLADFPNLLFIDHQAKLGALLGQLHKPALGQFKLPLHATLFPAPILAPACVAAVPLTRQGRMIGCLALGSLHAERFVASMASDFIEHLGSIIAICLENVINNERLKRIGLTDSLTGVNNRRYLELRLQEEIARARRHDFALSCLYIDIDHFKKINDSVGHQGGDEVLQEVARRIKAELRLSDALGRFGGEEFVVLLIDALLPHALDVAERIRASVAQRVVELSEGSDLQVTVSVGVSELSSIDRDCQKDRLAQQLIARADEGLYQAKAAGRNCVVG